MPSPATYCCAEQNDEAALARLLEQHPGEIAAAIIEPTGANGGRLPIDPEFLHALRRLTAEHGVLLIFDEVVNGFRVSPGGAQQAYGIKPDLTTLAKILAGGLPGGAVTGRKDILDLLDFKVDRGGRQGEDQPPRNVQRQPALGRGRHRDAEAGRRDRRLRPRQRLWRRAAPPGSTRFSRKSALPWAAYGTFSSIEIFTNPEGIEVTPTQVHPLGLPAKHFKGVKNAGLVHKLRLATMLGGVDFN